MCEAHSPSTELGLGPEALPPRAWEPPGSNREARGPGSSCRTICNTEARGSQASISVCDLLLSRGHHKSVGTACLLRKHNFR